MKRCGEMAPLTKDYSSVYLTENLDENIKIIKEIFKKDSTLRIRRIKLKDNVNECAIIYIDGMIKNEVLNDSVVRPLITAAVDIGEKGKIEEISSKILEACPLRNSVAVCCSGTITDFLILTHLHYNCIKSNYFFQYKSNYF